ncbi:patched domain-containing protein [Anaeramoeba flamelloides]|uniref:Patched domain-containing protein n=1 Tax=Anaeramoeba flamelloides TaxID=1746091 RepID=A0ABQ8YBG0_9EUKA|nr:patched domain-containing protein [Anaeramoeba flamelloides]
MNRWSKFCATFEEKLGDKLSKFAGIIYDHPYLSLLIIFLTILASLGGFYFQETENEIRKIYVPQDAPILVNERYYDEKWDSLPLYESIWLTSEPLGTNKLTKESIDLMFEYDKKIRELEITYDDKLYTYYDLCYVNPITSKCQVNGILDFWNYNQSLVNEDTLLAVINGQRNIITGQYLDETTGMMGEVKNDENQIIKSMVLTINYAMDQLGDNGKPLLEWESKFIDELLKIKNQLEEDNSKHKLVFNANSSIDNEIEKASASNPVTYIIGYMLMGVLLWLTIGNFKSKFTSHLYLSIGALIAIAFSVLCGFGVGGYFIKNTSLVSVLIFLMLALGVDDVYIIVKNFDLTDNSLNPRDRLTLTLKNSTSIVVTTLTDIAVMFIGLISPFNAIVYFCGYGCCCIAFVIFFQFTLFTLMLSFEAKRIHNKRNAFFPFMKIKTNNSLTKEQEKEREKEKQKKKMKKDVEISNIDPETNFSSETDPSSQTDSVANSNSTKNMDSDTGSKKKMDSDTNTKDTKNVYSDTDTKDTNDSKIDLEKRDIKEKKNDNESKLKLDIFQRFLKEKYGPFILNKKVSIIIMIIFVAYFGVSIYFATQVEEGFEETSVLPDDSYYQDTYAVLDEYYFPTSQAFFLVLKENTKYHEAETKNDLLKLLDDFRNNEKWVHRGPYGWYEDYLNYLQIAVDAPTLDSDGLPVNPVEFYSYLQYSFLQNPNYIHYSLGSEIIFNEDEDDINKQIQVSKFYFISTDLSETNDRVDFMYDLRDLTTDSEIDCFVYNAYYFLNEQYAIVKKSTLMNVGLALLVVLLLAFLFFIYSTNAILITLTVVMIDADIYGFLWLMGLKIEPISSVCLMMSVGFAVDYAAHIIHCYTTSKGKTRREKVLQSITEIGASVLLGGFTTFFGLTPVIIFATSEIFRTLVTILYATIIFGILHGFVFLPVVLQFLGAKGNTSVSNKKKKSTKQRDNTSCDSDDSYETLDSDYTDKIDDSEETDYSDDSDDCEDSGVASDSVQVNKMSSLDSQSKFFLKIWKTQFFN